MIYLTLSRNWKGGYGLQCCLNYVTYLQNSSSFRDRTVLDVQFELEQLCHEGKISRILHHRDHGEQIRELADRIEVAQRDFAVGLLIVSEPRIVP